jgi:nitroreductase
MHPAAARLAPSACNKQPWRFVVIEDQVARMRRSNEAFLAGIPMRWAESAGAIIVLGMKKSAAVKKWNVSALIFCR